MLVLLFVSLPDVQIPTQTSQGQAARLGVPWAQMWQGQTRN
jgi:hypothetical protein